MPAQNMVEGMQPNNKQNKKDAFRATKTLSQYIIETQVFFLARI
jgi:hypothetical protein